MAVRYRAGLALTLAIFLLLCGSSAGRQKRLPATPSAAELYSRRALREARIILQLKLLELREKRLERVRKAVERKIPIDQLLDIR